MIEVSQCDHCFKDKFWYKNCKKTIKIHLESNTTKHQIHLRVKKEVYLSEKYRFDLFRILKKCSLSGKTTLKFKQTCLKKYYQIKKKRLIFKLLNFNRVLLGFAWFVQVLFRRTQTFPPPILMCWTLHQFSLFHKKQF